MAHVGQEITLGAARFLGSLFLLFAILLRPVPDDNTRGSALCPFVSGPVFLRKKSGPVQSAIFFFFFRESATASNAYSSPDRSV